MKKFAIAAAVSALAASTSVAMAEVKVAPEGAKTLIRSTQSIPVGAAGSATLSPALIIAGIVGVGIAFGAH